MNRQSERVLTYMRTNGSITTLQAYEDLGITRLSARIWDLRDAGHVISATRKTVPTRTGEKATVCVYRLVG